MQWEGEVGVGTWIRERLDGDSTTMHSVVPRGFEAYARVFHPAQARSMPGRPVPTNEEWHRMSDAERTRLFALLIDAPATWSDAAAAFGTVLHPLAQWHRIVAVPDLGDVHGQLQLASHPLAPDGREFSAPALGDLDPRDLAPIAAHLVAHTSTPDDGHAAVWEGWGGLLGHFGHGPARADLRLDAGAAHEEMLARSIHDPFNNVFRAPTWQEGILPREISEGALLELPQRRHVLFTAPPRVFADPSWPNRAPWRDEHGADDGIRDDGQDDPAASWTTAQHPSLIWPADHAWVLVSEIDFDSTVIGGSAELIRAICEDPAIEALPLPAEASLTADADTVNRPRGRG
ncbi:hypothetical protein J2Y69_002601 [Microbacterium resistens]|uniref:Uncharacterized protein n=1 Tax=Microbacterium resistens TaxID=156977 RepID=A0ABU1SFD4_9MICO|nr:hypothetical protein [Microbacterium resistens]MDR6867993.1 hypothetical protein [Microbacterium resistens]